MRLSLALAKYGPVAAILILGACSHAIQTTSGADYLSAARVSAAPGRDGIDDAIREAAAVEPILRFPARIGIARIGRTGGRLSLMQPSSADGEAWAELGGELGTEFGELVPLSPLIAAMVAPEKPHIERSQQIRDVIDRIRIAAARQHLDAVFVYEVDATADSRNNPLSIADWTLIGAFVVPSQNVRAESLAQAILLDVRNGYPYGTVHARANDTTLSARFERDDAERALSERVEAQAVRNLARETRGFMRQLKVRLAALDEQEP